MNCAQSLEFFVDDLWENCQALLQRDIEVAMMTVPHNQGLDVPIPRVSTWNEGWDWCVKVYSLADSEATAELRGTEGGGVDVSSLVSGLWFARALIWFDVGHRLWGGSFNPAAASPAGQNQR